MNLREITGIGTQYVDCCEQWVRYNVVLDSQGLPLVYLQTGRKANGLTKNYRDRYTIR